ncbi:MAG: CHAD domain-containing protein [Alphaproteobacteria bacterium]|nr:CHAD domain-containing protein [Alphaproteobacteria bacterium]
MKFALSPEARRRVERYLDRAGHDGARQVKVLNTTYFDSPDRKLSKAGFTLRVRELTADAQRFRQTVKSSGNGTFERQEWEWAVDGPQPDLGRLAEVAAFPLQGVTGADIRPVFRTEITRTIVTLRPAAGAKIELALDEGAVVASSGSQPVRELELELKEGQPAALMRLGLELLETVPLSLLIESKAQRGFQLVDGARPHPHEEESISLEGGLSLKEAFRVLAARLVDDLMAHQPVVLHGDSQEGVHRMRIDVRRLRSLLVLFEPFLEAHAAGHFEDELRRLGQVLGAARDWDVFLEETLPRTVDGAADLVLARSLRELASQRRHSAHQAAKKALLEAPFSRFVLAMRLWTSEKGAVLKRFAPRPLEDEAPAMLSRLERKVGKRLRACDVDQPTSLHRLRKSLKKLRYGIQYLQSLYDGDAESYLARCNALQKRLGNINDLGTFTRLAEELAQGTRLDLAPAVGMVAENAERLAKKDLDRLGGRLSRFAKARPFWT